MSELLADNPGRNWCQFGHDAVGNRTGLADSVGGLTNYTYDPRNELTTIAQSGTGVAPKRVDMAYDAAGRMTTLTRSSDTAGTATVLVSKYAYDAADRLTTLTNQTSGGTVRSSYADTYDNADRLTSEARAWGANTDTVGYGYTNDNQLTGVTHTNGSFANESFGFDANGNRNTSGYATTAGNETTSGGGYTYTYDAEGNLSAKTGGGIQATYAYDTRNRLVEVDQTASGVHTVVAQYTYDALNRPIKVVENGGTRYTLYDGQTPLLDFSGTSGSTPTARYLSDPRAVDAVLARETAGGTVAWYLVDRLGTVRDIVNNSGAVIDHVDYTAYGTATDSAPSAGDRFKYAGMELDAATGFYYDRARWYNPVTGTFIGQDPISFAGGDASLFRYVHNSPINRIDPSGHWDNSNLGMVIVPTGDMLRDPRYFKDVTDIANQMNALSAKDKRERTTGIYEDKDGHIMVGIPGRIKGPKGGWIRGIVRDDLVGSHRNIDLTPLGECPKGWTLIGTIHTHPPDPNPKMKDPANSDWDPDNSNLPIGNSRFRVPWLVIDSDGKIWLIGPDVMGGPPNKTSR